MFRLQRNAYDEIIRWVEEHPTIEVTGFVKKMPSGTQVVIPMQNVAKDPAHDYAWDPAEMKEQWDLMDGQLAEPIAYYHSHPTGLAEPSETDMQYAYQTDLIYLIAGRGQLTAWLCLEPGILVNERLVLE